MKQKLDISNLRRLTRSRKKQQISSVEQSIITIQQYFLTPGLHCVTVPSHEQGRSLLRVCLDSLERYNDIGMITTALQRTPHHYRDIVREIALYGGHTDTSLLEEYLLTAFSCDFLIIEYNPELMMSPWFGQFEQLLHDYSVSKALPVIMCMYDDQAGSYN